SGVADLLANTNATSARFFMNGIDTRTRGVDVVLSYDMDMGDLGSLNLNAGFNYNDTDVTDIINPPAVLAAVGVEQDNLFATNELFRIEKGAPDSKFIAQIGWYSHPLELRFSLIRYGKTFDPSTESDAIERTPHEWVTNLEANVNIGKRISISAGANNIFDVYPQVSRKSLMHPTFNDVVFPYSSHSPFGFSGRFLFFKIAVKI
ncbi:MAG: TonB-dependent receptor, partial [Alphaproteobacteria bacterium]|nr:TonB-dependent receptor [Alphaproteobacteria bacterium]